MTKDNSQNEAPLLSCGEAIVQGLLDHKVDTVFALPGAQIYGFIDALASNKDKIKTIGARHEQTSAYMAFGYAKSTGKPGVCSVVPGPGLLNAGAAIVTAHGTNTPMLTITGDVTSRFKNRERRQLHELHDQLSIMRSMTKWAEHVEQPTQAPLLVARAFQEMNSGRKGAVALQAPWDVFGKKSRISRVEPLPTFPDFALDLDNIKEAAKLLASAKSPLILTGSGALDASDAVTALAETLFAPVVSFRGGRGVVSDEHPLGFNIAAGAKLWPQTDVALIIGSRFELMDLRWRYKPKGVKLIRIDIDPAESRRLDVDLNIISDANIGAKALNDALQKLVSKNPTRLTELAEVKAAALVDISKIKPQIDYLNVIRDVLPKDGFFVEEISQVGFTSIYGFPIYKPRTMVTAGFQGTLGFGFPTALGVKVANPDKAVVSIAGDGGFMFAAQELATAVQYGINLVTIVFNNSAYGNVLRDQKTAFSGRLLGSELMNPDFIKFAESFGVQGYRVNTPEALKPILEMAFAADAPVLIEVEIPRGSETSPWTIISQDYPDKTPF